MSELSINPGSFRDPSGRVFEDGSRVFRSITDSASDNYERVRDAGIFEKYAHDGRIVATTELDAGDHPIRGDNVRYVAEHPRLKFISYPYEWPFSLLKKAALFHLQLQLDLLGDGFVLSDASAYNVQFEGVHPIFIDVLSIRPYTDGEYWLAHNQFCEQFLNPLLMHACLGLHHNEWYRGRLEGIPSEAIAGMLSFRQKLSFRMFSHVVGPAKLQGRSERKRSSTRIKARPFPRIAYQGMLEQLASWIGKLSPANSPTAWQEYEGFHTYSAAEEQAKTDFIRQFVADTKPDQLWDIGCNTGAYSAAAIQAGAGSVIGFDFDRGSLDKAVMRAERERLNLLPLFLDGANPSPNQGWAQSERMGLDRRLHADAIIALAFIHHIAIGKNIPLDYAVDWLVSLAPSGIIEFVQKDDETVEEMLLLREDLFHDYNEANFRAALLQRADIGAERRNPENGRLLVTYRRKP